MRTHIKERLLLVLLGVIILVSMMLDEAPPPAVVSREEVRAEVTFDEKEMEVEYEGLSRTFLATETNRFLGRNGTIRVCLVEYETGEFGLHRYC